MEVYPSRTWAVSVHYWGPKNTVTASQLLLLSKGDMYEVAPDMQKINEFSLLKIRRSHMVRAVL